MKMGSSHTAFNTYMSLCLDAVKLPMKMGLPCSTSPSSIIHNAIMPLLFPALAGWQVEVNPPPRPVECAAYSSGSAVQLKNSEPLCPL